MSILILDIGNTALKAACFQGGKLQKAVRAPLHDAQEVEEALLRLISYEPQSAFISNVNHGQPAIEAFLKRASIPARYFESTLEIPLENRYETPQTLGKDRIANAVAANKMFPSTPIVVIDAGTCIKFDFITRKNEYFGGSIAPGIDMRFRALHEFTARLPLEARSETVYLIGKNTREAIQSGVINGAMAEVKGVLEQYQMTHKDLQVIITGGDIGMLERSLKTRVQSEPWLTLKGLHEIALHQQPA
jgi:type III pantothenate kinase